jgi:hypothetical protein
MVVNGFVRHEQFNSSGKMPLHAMKNDIILDARVVSQEITTQR